MAIIPIGLAGERGIIQDLSQHELPNNAWSDASNIRFLDGYAHQFYGHGQVYGTPVVIPYHVLPIIVGSARYWIYTSLAKIYAVTNSAGSAVHTDLTRSTGGDYSATANSWTSTLLGGIPILNPGNTTDVPQRWDLNIANKFTALDNWPASTYCKSMRAYKNYLVALNITKPVGSYPFMVKWSHPADPGSVPTSWDETDPTTDAGEFDLSEGYDPIVDGLQLRDSLIIYKEGSVWRMDFTGGPFVFRSSKVLGTSGAMNRNCVVEVDGFHVALTTNDIVIHDGVQAHSVLDKKMRRWLFQNLDVDATGTAFVFKNNFYNEVFICFAKIGSTIPDLAVVYNYVDKTCSKRVMPNIHHAAYGPVDNSLSGTWAGDSDPWSSDLTVWDGPDYVPSNARVLMGSNDTKMLMLDSSASFDGVAPTSYLERKGLSFGKPENYKLIRGVRPRITGNVGETVIIKIGTQDDPYDTPTYTSMTHTIGATVQNHCLVSGRYISVRFESGTAYTWRLDSYDLDVEIQGEW